MLAFRYTATIKNVFQDIIYAIQVDLSSNFRLKINMPAMDARFRNNMIKCGTLLGIRPLIISENTIILPD